LRLLPPSFGRLKESLVGEKRILKLERNNFILELEEQRKKGPNALFHYLNSERYKALYDRAIDVAYKQPANIAERRKEKEKKTSRIKA